MQICVELGKQEAQDCSAKILRTVKTLIKSELLWSIISLFCAPFFVLTHRIRTRCKLKGNHKMAEHFPFNFRLMSIFHCVQNVEKLIGQKRTDVHAFLGQLFRWAHVSIKMNIEHVFIILWCFVGQLLIPYLVQFVGKFFFHSCFIFGRNGSISTGIKFNFQQNIEMILTFSRKEKKSE